MPGLTGLDRLKRMPLVAIGCDDAPMRARAMQLGAVDVLTKPFDVESLLEAIERAVTKNEDIENFLHQTQYVR